MSNLPTQEDWDLLYSANGQFMFRQMFLELSTPLTRKNHPPIFTLKPRPHGGLPSAYEVYMTSIDEYDAATKLVPHMKAWDALLKTTWWVDGCPQHNFEGIAEWRRHMKARDVSQAKQALQEKVLSGDVTAAKAILAESRVKAPVGRKSKKNPVEEATISRIDQFRKTK